MDKVLTFDCYGTLIDTKPIIDTIINIARENKLDQKDAVNTYINYEDRIMYGEPYIPYDKLIYEDLEYCDMEFNSNVFTKSYDEIIEVHKKLKPFIEVVATLKELHKKGYQLAIMSNSVQDIMTYHLDMLGTIFDDVFLADDMHVYKPNIEFFKYVEEKLELKKREHWHIAKGYWWDIIPCSIMGWSKIWVNRNNRKGNSRHEPYKEVNTLDEVLNIL
jgi:2-haloacid dehalogenase